MKNCAIKQTVPVGVTFALLTTTMSLVGSLPAHARYGFIDLADGWRCEGQFQGNSGNGLCVQRDTVDPGNPYQYYRGDVRNGTFTGNGVLVYENNDRYEGQMRNGRPNGKGTFIDVTNNRRYVGDFRNGEFHGRGFYTFGNGSRYEGQFAGSQPHGIGTFRANTDDGNLNFIYTGRFYLGIINGNGTVTNADGSRCTGVFYGNDIVGYGNCTYPSGNFFRSYTGELKRGRPDGRGTAVYNNGTRYTGEFRGGNPGVSTSNRP